MTGRPPAKIRDTLPVRVVGRVSAGALLAKGLDERQRDVASANAERLADPSLSSAMPSVHDLELARWRALTASEKVAVRKFGKSFAASRSD